MEILETDSPIHDWFELSYASYLVLQRLILRSMPLDWQHRFVELLTEIEEEFDTSDVPNNFSVCARGEGGRFIKDNYRDYRRGVPPPRRNG